MSALSDLLGNVEGVVTAGLSLTVETSVSPPLSINLDSTTTADGVPSPVLKLLKPRVVVTKDGIILATVTPYGDPSLVRPYVYAVGFVICLILVLWAVSK